MTKRGLKEAVPGMRVQLTGYFLKATGQYTGQDANAIWVVQECSCLLCSGKSRRGETGFAAVNERPACDCMTPAVVEKNPDLDHHPECASLRWRHIALSNLQQYGKLPKVADLSDQVKP